MDHLPSEVSNSDSTLVVCLRGELRISRRSLHSLIWRNPKLAQHHAHYVERQAKTLRICHHSTRFEILMQI